MHQNLKSPKDRLSHAPSEPAPATIASRTSAKDQCNSLRLILSESWLYKWLQGKGVHLAVNSEHVQTSLIHSDFMEAITREADHGCDDCRALILACFLLPLLLLILCITSAAKVRLRLLARCACRVSRRRTRPKN